VWITFSQSAPESADLTSDCMQDFEPLAEALAQSAWWRGKPSPLRSWERRCKKGGWMRVLSGAAIWPISQPPNFPVLTGTPEAIPASPFPPLVNGEGRTIGDICGPSSPDNSRLFGQEECFSRMWRDTSHSVSVMCLQTWKNLVSDVRSACTARRKSARRTEGNEFSSSDWPTPTANEDAAGTSNGKMQKMLGNHPDIRGRPGPETPKDATNRPGPLNPDWVEMLMGFPIGWTDCGR